jgi:hypothetical protein
MELIALSKCPIRGFVASLLQSLLSEFDPDPRNSRGSAKREMLTERMNQQWPSVSTIVKGRSIKYDRWSEKTLFLGDLSDF